MGIISQIREKRTLLKALAYLEVVGLGCVACDKSPREDYKGEFASYFQEADVVPALREVAELVKKNNVRPFGTFYFMEVPGDQQVTGKPIKSIVVRYFDGSPKKPDEPDGKIGFGDMLTIEVDRSNGDFEVFEDCNLNGLRNTKMLNVQGYFDMMDTAFGSHPPYVKREPRDFESWSLEQAREVNRKYSEVIRDLKRNIIKKPVHMNRTTHK